MADALAQALAWRARVAQLRKLRGRQTSSPTDPLFPQYGDDPVGFFIDVLGVTPWERQIEILQSTATQQKTAVRSGHKVAKSNSAAGLALWWWATKPRGSVVMTSSTDDQVRLILWSELTKLYHRAKRPLGGRLHEAHRSGLIAPDGRRIVGIATKKTDNMGGFSGDQLLFIADESSGIDEGIFDAIEGNMAGGAHLLMLGNPIRTSGRFYEAFHGARDSYKTIHIASTETPNVIERRSVVPGLATAGWVDDMTKKYGGPGNPIYDVRVGGNFPSQGENAVIGLVLVEAALAGWRYPKPEDGVLELGVDVARFGDDETVIQARRGNYAYPPVALRNSDGPTVAGEVLKLVRELRVSRDDGGAMVPEVPRVKIDAIGVGSSPYDVMVRSEEIKTLAVNVSETATDESYHSLRSQVWYAARDWLKEGGMIQSNAKLESELVAPIFEFDARGRIEVESKEKIKKKLLPPRSPDHADALCLAVFNPPEAYVGSVNVDWMNR